MLVNCYFGLEDMHPLQDLSFQVTVEFCLLNQRSGGTKTSSSKYNTLLPSAMHSHTPLHSCLIHAHTHLASLPLALPELCLLLFVLKFPGVFPFLFHCGVPARKTLHQLLQRDSDAVKGLPSHFSLSLFLSFLWCRRGRTMLVFNVCTFDDTH